LIRVVAALAVPDQAVSPPCWSRVVIVTVVTDGRRVWHVYPDGGWVCVDLPAVSKPSPT
jgi:hypothetical protein